MKRPENSDLFLYSKASSIILFDFFLNCFYFRENTFSYLCTEQGNCLFI